MELQHFFPILGYFSLTTLSTVGFGDITALTLESRYGSPKESPANSIWRISVARLVGMRMMSRSAD